MTTVQFWSQEGITVPAVTAEEMREIDRVAMEEFGLGMLQMMENAGRNLAENAQDMLGGADGEIVILAGAGGNGGGGLSCARHLDNHGYKINIVLDRAPNKLKGAPAAQHYIVAAAGVRELHPSEVNAALSRAVLVIDALIGYSLNGTPRGRTAELIQLCNQYAALVLALDVPSGLNATTGDTPGVVSRADRVLTLALPKTGLCNTDGDIFLADIGIPVKVYDRLGLFVPPLFANHYWLPLYTHKP
jgi:NAD(P)H-hydrate epimerase